MMLSHYHTLWLQSNTAQTKVLTILSGFSLAAVLCWDVIGLILRRQPRWLARALRAGYVLSVIAQLIFILGEWQL